MKEKRGIFTKILAVAGTVLVWIPLLAPVFFSVMFLIRTGMFRMDYLMPAELFLFALVGGVLLIWAALRARARWRLGRLGDGRRRRHVCRQRGDCHANRTGLGRDSSRRSGNGRSS